MSAKVIQMRPRRWRSRRLAPTGQPGAGKVLAISYARKAGPEWIIGPPPEGAGLYCGLPPPYKLDS
jgi:hypothetical protein